MKHNVNRKKSYKFIVNQTKKETNKALWGSLLLSILVVSLVVVLVSFARKEVEVKGMLYEKTMYIGTGRSSGERYYIHISNGNCNYSVQVTCNQYDNYKMYDIVNFKTESYLVYKECKE